MKFVLIGQAPGPSGIDDPLGGACGRRLSNLLGHDVSRFARRVNLLKKFPGKQGKGDAFPMDEARASAARFEFADDECCGLLVGKRVAAAFGLRADYFMWCIRPDGRVVCAVPHPSGINRWWNDSSNMDRARQFFRELAAAIAA